ncbi:MAG: DUF6918 family protein [Sciscionella sp.]
MPQTLNELLLSADNRPAFVEDCAGLIDAEVAAKSGVSGLAIKSGYAMVTKIKPGIIPDAVNSMSDDLVARLQPYYADYVAAGATGGFGNYLDEHSDDAAESLLAVTDARAERSKRPTLKKVYDGLRPKGKSNVVTALPKLGALIEKHRVA